MISRIALLMLLSLSLSVVASGAEPNWNGTIVARGQQRVEIQRTPMIDRPYRPLHFYGNTVRRRHYRGSSTPRPVDVVQGFRAFLVR